MIKIKYLIILTLALLMTVTIPSCNLYPDSETRTEDTDIVITRFDPSANFSTYLTYSRVDEVLKIDADTSDDPDPVPDSDFILAQIDANMLALGYDRVSDSDNPDVRIVATATDIEITSYYYYDYWYWYGGWYGWGGWWGYPPCCYYYPPYYPVTSSYKIGTLFMDMLDTKDKVSGTDTIPIVWNAIYNGILDDTKSGLRNRIKTNIDQAFDQSPYLNPEE